MSILISLKPHHTIRWFSFTDTYARHSFMWPDGFYRTSNRKRETSMLHREASLSLILCALWILLDGGWTPVFSQSEAQRDGVVRENLPFQRPAANPPNRFDYSSLRAGDYDLKALRTSQSIELDGLLTESDWGQAAVAGDFYQLQPAEGFPATQPTEVRVLYDEENLYVGFMCYDDHPDDISARDMTRDARIEFSNDMVQVVIAPLEGGREAYTFQTNPNGADRFPQRTR